jgi:putative peptidoglycan lipid II flippase
MVMTLPNAFARVHCAHAGDRGARSRAVWGCLLRWAGLLGVASAAVAAAPRPLLALLAGPGGGALPAQGVLALRLAAPTILLQGLFLAMAAAANAESWHTPVALLSTGFSLGGLLGALAFQPWLGPAGVLAGVLAASAAQVALLAACFSANGMGPAGLTPGDGASAFRELVRVAAPAAAGAALLKLDTVILVRLAAGLRAGDVFLLAVVGMLINVPMSVANQAVAHTTVPELVRSLSRGDHARFRRLVLSTAGLTALVIAPIAALMVVDPDGLTSVLFQRGRFTAASVARAAPVLRVWAAGGPLLALGLYMDDVLTALGHRSAVAAGRGLAVLAMGLACWWGARAGGLAGMVGAYVLVNAVRLVISAEAVARQADIPRAAFWGPILAIMAVTALGAATGWAAAGSAGEVRVNPLARLALEAAVIGGVGLAGAALAGLVGFNHPLAPPESLRAALRPSRAGRGPAPEVSTLDLEAP